MIEIVLFGIVVGAISYLISKDVDAAVATGLIMVFAGFAVDFYFSVKK